MLLQNTLLLALIYRYTNTGWVRAAGVLGGSVAAIASVLSGHIRSRCHGILPGITKPYLYRNDLFHMTAWPQASP